jgi:hypothetical protein
VSVSLPLEELENESNFCPTSVAKGEGHKIAQKSSKLLKPFIEWHMHIFLRKNECCGSVDTKM